MLPFGLQNSSSTFQRLMDSVLRDCQDFSCAYIDDICKYSQTWEDHVAHLQYVFQLLLEAGLTVKPEKCKLAKQQVEYLGHVIGNGTVKPLHDKGQSCARVYSSYHKEKCESILRPYRLLEEICSKLCTHC